MDVNEIASAATAMAEARTGQAVQMSVLKKAINLQGEGAIQLLLALPSPVANNPPHLGNRVDTFA